MKTITRSFAWPLVYLIAATFGIVLAGCSSAPSAGDGERTVQERINQNSDGRIRLVKFQKTNGVQGELLGVKVYSLEFEAIIEFSEDCIWVTGPMGNQLNFTTSKPRIGTWGQGMDDRRGPEVKKGQVVSLSGVIRFLQKEKGWAVQDLTMTGSKLTDGSAGAPAAASTRPQPPPQSASQAGTQRAECRRALMTIGGSFLVWGMDHGVQFPCNVSTNEGGTLELCSKGADGFESNAARIFQVMSNELKSTALLVCPSDVKRHPATDFGHVLPENVSFQARSGANISTTNPKEIVVRCPIHGTTLYCDGSVDWGTSK